MHPETPELQLLLFEYSCTTFRNQEQVTDLLQDVHPDTWLSCILLRPRFHWSMFFWACGFEILVHRLGCIHHLWAAQPPAYNNRKTNLTATQCLLAYGACFLFQPFFPFYFKHISLKGVLRATFQRRKA